MSILEMYLEILHRAFRTRRVQFARTIRASDAGVVAELGIRRRGRVGAQADGLVGGEADGGVTHGALEGVGGILGTQGGERGGEVGGWRWLWRIED